MTEDGRRICKHGAKCHNQDPDHRKNFFHPLETAGKMSLRWRGCRYGSQCTRRDAAHLDQFSHPGDRTYRNGIVVFEPGQAPAFETLWQLFSFYDANESSYLDRGEFAPLLNTVYGLAAYPPASRKLPDEAWSDVVGKTKFMNFAQFISWVECMGVKLPVGIDGDAAEETRKCRFILKDGSRCSCAAFQPAPDHPMLCQCGHKKSMHRSDHAEKSGAALSSEATQRLHWDPGEAGLVKVLDEKLLLELQGMLVKTHKVTDNWTRDRGCRLHGVNGCGADAGCVFKNRAPVPTGYTLHRAFRNQNPEVIAKYMLCRTAISEECRREVGDASFTTKRVMSTVPLDTPLERDTCNEWRLLHGTSLEAAKSICEANFSVHLAGTGATWKDPGKDKGVPLYGYGLYFSERITKADEYAVAIPEGERYGGMFVLLVCRVVGGRTNVVTTNAIDTEKLQTDVFDGPYHSVLGDRVASLGKPYREVVVYDNHQVYPEFVLIYSREFG